MKFNNLAEQCKYWSETIGANRLEYITKKQAKHLYSDTIYKIKTASKQGGRCVFTDNITDTDVLHNLKIELERDGFIVKEVYLCNTYLKVEW